MQRDQRLPIAFRQREITDERFIRAAVEAIARNVVRHRAARIAAHHFVDAEVLAIEVNPAAQVQIRVEGGVKRLLQPIDIDAELAQQPHRHRAEVGARRLQRFAAAVAEQHAVVGAEFVALGVAAEVVMVVDQQNALLLAFQLLPETGSRQPADAGADHHQIELFNGGHAAEIKGFTVAPQLVRMLERARMVTPQPGQRRRVVQGLIGGLRRRAQDLQRRQPGGDGDRHPVEKIASGDTHIGFLSIFIIIGRPGPARRPRYCADNYCKINV